VSADVSASSSGARDLSFTSKSRKCDGDQANVNLQTLIDLPAQGTVGEPFIVNFNVENFGPGDATGVRLSIPIPKNTFLDSVVPTQGDCESDGKKVNCNIGSLPDDGTAGVQLDLIPLKTGTLTITSTVIANNTAGPLFPTVTKDTAPIAAGNNAILNVTMGCTKAGTAGTVTISPDSNGGTTTCTCPDPNSNPPLQDFLCAIESYAAKTDVTLTATATAGQFDKWTKDCKGKPAASCTLTLDPGAQNPDKTTGASFKP
jgi:hypothetical protein